MTSDVVREIVCKAAQSVIKSKLYGEKMTKLDFTNIGFYERGNVKEKLPVIKPIETVRIWAIIVRCWL